jgi:hypothetical protein
MRRTGFLRRTTLLASTTVLLGIVALVVPAGPTAGAWKVPSCSTLSAAFVDSILGPLPGVVKPDLMVDSGVRYLECDHGVYN